MMMLLGGRGEAYDLTLILFGSALLFGLLFFVLWFPAWRRRRLEEQREAEYMKAYLENAAHDEAKGAEDPGGVEESKED